jgi:hypothetical protein
MLSSVASTFAQSIDTCVDNWKWYRYNVLCEGCYKTSTYKDAKKSTKVRLDGTRSRRW